MKSRRYLIILSILILGSLAMLSRVSAEEPAQVGVTVEAGQYAAVKGDVDKFRALNWMKDGYSGGLSELSYEKKLNDDTSVSFEGHTAPKENDNEADFLLRKGDMGFIRTKYQSFRKYYDQTGGVYSRFTTLSGRDLSNQDLHLDIGKFLFEAGLGPVNDPDIDLMYERQTKEGMKSLVMWTGAVEGGTTRNIGPVWEQLDQTVDTITLKEKKDVSGVTLKGQQQAQFVSSHNLTEKDFLNTSAVPSSANKIRRQDETPEAQMFSSALRGEKWILNDKTFMGLGYHFVHTHSAETLSLKEYNNSLSPFNFSNPKQSLPSDGESRDNEHVWVGDIHTDLTSNLSFISNVKFEYSGTQGSSSLLEDLTPANAPPNGITDRTEMSTLMDKINRVGEHFSLRYGGIPHASVYAELEMEQLRDWVYESRNSVAGESAGNTNENFSQERFANSQKTIWTLGSRVVPSRFFVITTQVRQHFENNDYDNVALLGPGSNTVLLDALKMNGDEVNTTVTWKPYRWLQNSFRYQLFNNKYFPRGDGLVETKSRMLSSVYSYDVSLQPLDPLFLTVSFSREDNSTKTKAGSTSTTQIPGFKASVDSWLFSASYSPKDDLSIINSIQYSLADNFNDFSATGLPLGASFREFDASTGLQWTLKKGISIKPAYEYASYRGNPLIDVGNYSANIFRLDVAFQW